MALKHCDICGMRLKPRVEDELIECWINCNNPKLWNDDSHEWLSHNASLRDKTIFVCENDNFAKR